MSAPSTKPRSPVARWSAKLAGLPALSVRQPWAWLIVSGFKDIENRSWCPRYRGPLLIHAGASAPDFTFDVIEDIEKRHGIVLPGTLRGAGIVGVVDLVDCLECHNSPWYQEGAFAWVLANPRQLKLRPCKGAVNLFRPKFESE